jgi:pimeloyl-ACP methyl ester carboxylesterase
MNRTQLAAVTALLATIAFHVYNAHAQSSHDVVTKEGVLRPVQVPFDRQNAALGTFQLYYELGRAYDSSKPTVFVIADGQQYYVRKGAIAPLQDELFGDGLNVVGIIGRGSNETVRAKVRTGDQTDWLLAYKLLRSEQWVDDIEAVREAVVGRNGQISLYGRSGGGLLVDQYLAKYPQHVRTVFSQAAVNRFIDAEFGLNSDKFWDEIGKNDPSLRKELLAAISAHPDERARIFLLLQRQNFFVSADQLPQSRAALIHTISVWDIEKLHSLVKQYQVDAILEQLRGSDNPAGNVRLFEFFAPLSNSQERLATNSQSRVDPDYEVLRFFATPLLELLADRKIPVPTMDLRALNKVNASVYLLAGYFDHTADYRSQIALASHFPVHRLLLLADNHDFLALSKTGLYPQLIQAALLHGSNSQEVQRVEAQLAPLRYSEF